jgi:beta-phosphoglucomutase-like phosphatase (HAD superfamily)
MVGGLNFAVAGLAVRGSGCLVVEDRIAPVRSVMALGTLTRGVVGRSIFAVAGLAIRGAAYLVVEGCISPIGGVVTLGAVS